MQQLCFLYSTNSYTIATHLILQVASNSWSLKLMNYLEQAGPILASGVQNMIFQEMKPHA